MQMNWMEALVEFGISHDMETMPLGYLDEHGNHTTVDGVHGMRQVDSLDVLEGVSVGDRYKVIQTNSYADIGDRITGQTGAEFVEGGTLRGGRMTFLQAKLPSTIRVKGTNDIIEENITFLNSFDGSTPFMILPLGFRIFCSNQMAAINKRARNQGCLKIRHTASAGERLKQADEAVLEMLNAFKSFEIKLNWLTDIKFNDAMMDLASRRLFSVKEETPEDEIATRTINNMRKVQELTECGQGQHIFKGTAYSFFNGCTEWSDHHRSLRTTTNPFEAKLIGSGANFKDKALQVIEQVIAEAA